MHSVGIKELYIDGFLRVLVMSFFKTNPIFLIQILTYCRYLQIHISQNTQTHIFLVKN